jgi:hypothetical protein
MVLNNVKLNNLANVKVFNQVMTDNQTEKLTHPGFSGGNTTYSDVDFFKTHFHNPQNVREIEVQCTSIDRFVKEYKIEYIALL